MVDPLVLRRWFYRLLLPVIATVFLFFHLLPLHVGAAQWPAPDLLVVFAFAWVMRRPEYVPVVLVAVLVVIHDMLFLRPPGVWAALAVIGLEFLRARAGAARDLPFWVEWAQVTGVLVAMTLGYRLILALFMVERAGLGLSLLQLMMSIAVYPLVVFISVNLLGVRRIGPGEIDRIRTRS